MNPIEPRLDLSILVDRFQRLVRLDVGIFDEIRQDAATTVPAVLVVALSSMLAGIGGWLWWLFQDYPDASKVFLQSVLLGSVFSVALWIVWMLVAWVILTQFFREEADWQQMLRAMGMAAVPLALSLAMFIPAIGFGIGLASLALFFGLTAVAIQAVTPANPARVLIANLGGFAVWSIVLGLLVTSDSYLAPGIFLFDAPGEALSDVADLLG